MFRLVKFLLVLGLIFGLAYGASFAGSISTAGKVVGPSPQFMGERDTKFMFKGVEELDGNPRAWVHKYGPTELPGVRNAMVYVNWDGKLIGTSPRNLAERVQLYRDRDP